MKYFFAIIVVALASLGISGNGSVESNTKPKEAQKEKQETKSDGGVDLPPGAMPVQFLEFQPIYINPQLN